MCKWGLERKQELARYKPGFLLPVRAFWQVGPSVAPISKPAMKRPSPEGARGAMQWPDQGERARRGSAVAPDLRRYGHATVAFAMGSPAKAEGGSHGTGRHLDHGQRTRVRLRDDCLRWGPALRDSQRQQPQFLLSKPNSF